MAITVTRANYTRTLYRTVLLLGLQDPNYNVPTVKDGAPFTLDDIKEAVMQADVDQALVIVDTLDHPYRNFFFTETPTNISYGARIPVALGPHSKVVINAGVTSMVGKLARNRQHVENCLAHPELYGAGTGLYWPEHGHLYFVGTTAAVHSPTVDLNRTTVASTDLLMNPDAYTNGVIARSFKMLYMNGQDRSHRLFYIDQSERFDMRIQGKALDLPEPERFQQLNN